MTTNLPNTESVLTSVAIRRYADEILRWNKQFNLISRQQTEQTLQSLLRQSAQGCEEVWRTLIDPIEPGNGPLWYFDLGSGAGLPGFVWHTMLAGTSHPQATWLVEPRDKRAWFLGRLAAACSVPSYQVLQERWGRARLAEDADPQVRPHTVLISLKALHLTDDEVLAGLAAAITPHNSLHSGACDAVNVVIARYYPAGQRLTPELVDELGLSEPGNPLQTGDLRFVTRNHGVLGVAERTPDAASIIFSCYQLL